MQTWVDLKFADGEYRFALGLQQISELEKKCDAGIGRIYGRTLAGRYGLTDADIVPQQADYRFAELVEVVRQGLIGGGSGLVDGSDVKVSSVRANDLVANYVTGPDRDAIVRTWALAASVLSACIDGYDPPKKDEPVAPAP